MRSLPKPPTASLCTYIFIAQDISILQPDDCDIPQFMGNYRSHTTVYFFLFASVALDCEQFHFSSKICEEESKTSKRASSWLWASSDARAANGSRHCLSLLPRHANSHVCTPTSCFAFAPADFREKERLLAVHSRINFLNHLKTLRKSVSISSLGSLNVILK